jgi:hypothetical protein
MEDHYLLQEDQEDQEDQEYQEYQEYHKYQEFHVQSTKTLSYSHHQGRFEDIQQQESRIPSAKANHEDQNFQASIGDNHGRS